MRSQEGTSGDRADAGTLHQAKTPFIFARSLGNDFVVVGDARIELIRVDQQIVDALPGIARQFVEMFAETLAQTGHLLRQDDAEFRNQATQTVITCSTLCDKALAGAVQASMPMVQGGKLAISGNS